MALSGGKKAFLIVVGIALLLLAGLVLLIVLNWRRHEEIVLQASEGPAFEVRVDQGTRDRPPWEIPGVIFGSRESGPRFDQTSAGARVVDVGPHHLELSAEDGWNLLIETDAEGRLTPATRAAFPITLGGRPVKFNCRPAEQPNGYLVANPRGNSGDIDGNFSLEVTRCINAVSGKTALWPSWPMRIRGKFIGLRPGRR